MFGFHRGYVGGTPPEFAILSRDGLAIMCAWWRRLSTSARTSGKAGRGTSSSGSATPGAARRVKANGADVAYGPIVQEAYRMKEFAVRDREGYVLGFGQSLAAD